MNLPDAIASVADRPEPSEAQIKAGNYPKGHRNLHGMRISVENPQGSIRRGKSADGQPWASQLTHHYGYIRGAWGRDKDHLDIYLGPDAESADRVFVVDQMNPDNAKFDEHKVMLGFRDADDAREAYLDQFPEGWNGLGGVTELPLSSFKKWAFQKGRRVKPLSTEFAEATAQHYDKGGLVRGLKAVAKALKGDSAVNSTRANFESADKALSKLLRPSAVKEPGGNWMPYAGAAGLVNRNLENIPDPALRLWSEKQLTRYIKNDLGTARDPLLKLEAEGRLHMSPEDVVNAAAEQETYLIDPDSAGPDGLPDKFGGDEVHKKLTGRDYRTPWEAATDGNILKRTAKEAVEEYYGQGDDAAPEWMQKLPPRTPIYDLVGTDAYVAEGYPQLGFDHVLDYLTAARQAADAGDRTNPLVARGLHLTADQLSRTSVADAVAKTHEWNKLLDAQKLGDMNKGVKQVHWSDPDSGFQIVELDPEGLAAEGAAMRHCVGGYCSQVADGSSRILSVRDADGKPYATVEVGAGEVPNILQIQGPRNGEVDAAAQPALRALIRGQVPGLDKWGNIRQVGRSGLIDFGKSSEAVKSNIRWPGGSVDFSVPGGLYTRAELAEEAMKQGVPEDVARKHFGDIEGLMKKRNYADGGSVKPQATPITDDMYAEALARFAPEPSALDKALRWAGGAGKERLVPATDVELLAAQRPYIDNLGRRIKGQRPEAHNNRAASAEMPLVAARTALAAGLGQSGDWETLARMLIPGVSEEAVLPTSEYFKKVLPTLGLDVEGAHGQLADGVTHTAMMPAAIGGLTQIIRALGRGAARAGVKAADAMDSWRDSYIPRRADIDVILDRAGNILNPRPAPPAYAEGGGVQAINDYSDAQYAAAREWAAGKTGAEVAAKGTELGLTADQFAKVLNNPAITGADVAANGYGTTGGLNAAYMNATYDAPGQFTNPTETIATGTWQGGSGANATELANAQAWSTGKTGAQIAAQAQAMGLTPEQLYQVFGQEQFGAGLGGYGTESGWQRNNMVWDGTRFVEQPTPQVAAPPDSTWTPAQPLPTPPTAPAPEVHAPTGYLQQTVSGSQAWRAGAPGAQTGWTAAPQYGGGGLVKAVKSLERLKDAYENAKALRKTVQPTVEAYIAAQLPEFKAAFGESKVRDPSTGEVTPLFHYGNLGTKPNNKALANPKGLVHLGTEYAAEDRSRSKIHDFFNENPDLAYPEAEAILERDYKVQPYFVDIQRPYETEDLEDAWHRAPPADSMWDGLVYENIFEDPGSISYAPYNIRPQLKLVPSMEALGEALEGRRRLFDMSEPSVHKAEGGSVSAPTLDFAELKRQYDPYLFDNNDPYWFTPAAGLDTFGWRIGGSDIAGIKRGAAALGMTYQDAVGGGGGEGETNGGTPEQYGGWDALARAENQPQWMRTQLVNTQTGGESGSADSWAEQTLPDLAAIRTHFGLPEDASEADIFRAVNQKYGDLYSITGTRNGWDNADLTNGIEDPRTHVTATFRESDGQLSPLQVGPEFQYKRSSFFEDLAPALGVMAPMLGGMFLGPLGSSISGSLTQAGVPSFLANAAPNILGKGALSALSGGNFWDGAASGLLNAGTDALRLPKPVTTGVKIAGNAALKGKDPVEALKNPGVLLNMVAQS